MTRIVLVTGGTSGLGRAVAERFAADGATVLVTGRHAGTVDRTAKELGVHGLVCDATDPAQVAALGTRLDAFAAPGGRGRLDVLVNAAGGLPEPASGGGHRWRRCSRSGCRASPRTCSAPSSPPPPCRTG